MPSTTHAQLRSNEAAIALAIVAIDSGEFNSIQKAAAAFGVSKMTLTRRRDGTRSRRDTRPPAQVLTKLEEEAIVQYILDLDSRGFPTRLEELRDMADSLLRSRGAPPVGKNWPSNFIRRTNQLKTRLNRKYDYQRSKCEDPAIIEPWFRLVENMIRKYGILEDDVYNFDESGFQMGIIGSSLVITATERRARPKSIQPGNRVAAFYHTQGQMTSQLLVHRRSTKRQCHRREREWMDE